jgi:hypothetical protein
MKRRTLQNKHSAKGRITTTAMRALGVAAATIAAASCNELDTTRVAPPSATLGDDIYGILCDRLGASSFPEDLTGASFASICHYDDKGNYGSKVDTTILPPPGTAKQKEARRLSIAKLERMAQRRGDLVRALNATFPDEKIPDVTKNDPNATIRLHDALMAFAQGLTPLYESNPIEKKADPLMPMQTRAMARMFESFAGPGTCSSGGKSCLFDADCGAGNSCAMPVRDALSHMWARRGYRPFQVGLGVVRPALAYPKLRDLTKSAIALLAPGGAASGELQQVLTVLKQEMLTASPTLAPLPDLTVDASKAQPNRPRETIEFASALFLQQNDLFASSPNTPPAFIAQRDRRGIVVPSGNTPGQKGTVQSPFVDLDNNGYADIDAFGRFVGGDGKPLGLDWPFGIPGETTSNVDSFGRPTTVANTYSYIDTQRTLLGALTKHLTPLVDPTIQAAGDPNAWQKEHETLMYALAGASILLGDREDAMYDYAAEGAKGQQITYKRFNPDTSPLPDLVHAAGQLLADPDSDAVLLGTLDLLKNHEGTVARLLGAALRIRDISLQHDQLAAQGKEPKAELAYEVPIWDEMAQVVNTVLQHPGLLERLLASLANDVVVTPKGGAMDMGDALSKFVTYKDELTYNKHGTHYDGTPGGINGPAVNLTVDANGYDTSDPKTPVDNQLPRNGKNISCMQRSLQLITDANGGPACNKNGAKVAAKIGGASLSWPLLGNSYNECELFKFDNLAVFYLDSLLPANHPKRSLLNIKPGDLNTILNLLGVFVSKDDLLQQSSDINGLTLHPEPYALNRLVFFGASSSNYPGMPDEDLINKGQQVNKFVSGTIEPISCAWCPPDGAGVPTCQDKSGTVRVRDPNTIFLWERFGFTDYLAPVVEALANTSCAPDLSSCDLADTSGEQIFGSLVSVLNRHWPGPDYGAECSKTSKDTYCSEAGVNRYEPLLADAFVADIVPALHEFAQVATQLSKITVQRGPNAGQTWTGAQVMAKMTEILFSQDYAKAHNIVDRKGKAGTTWTDGTPQAQLTVFNLFADGLHKMDQRFADACKNATDMAACLADVESRKGQWKRARSQLVDEFLAIDGSGSASKFKNTSVVPTLISTLELTRQQLNAHCPDRESGAPCTWAKKDLGDKLAGVIGRPVLAALVDMLDKMRQDEPSRRQLETFLHDYVLAATTDDGQALQGMLASVADMLQVLADDGDLTPILSAAADGVSPDSDPKGPGAGSMTIKVLKALTDDTYDRYHVMDHVLPNLVTPMDKGQNLSPIEIFMDVIADVNRIDASDAGAFAPDDYEGVMGTMQNFMTDKTRGIEQLYTIIQKRPKP